MRLRVVIFLAIVVLIAACQGPPPTQIVMVVTATPAENIPTQTPYIVVVTATQQIEPEVTEATDLTPTQMPAQSAFTPIPVLNAYPTNTIVPIQVAEQIFEGGRMFWLEPSRQIWVMVESGTLNGRWFVFDDTFQEGEAESDPTIVAPDGYIQPIRGFGKVWRDNTNIREALGWATSNELGYVSNYEYHPGGSLNSRGLYEAGPGYHIIYSQTNQAIRFNEGLNEGLWTWQFVNTDATATVTP
jgi:hypothetical protein